MVQTRASDLAAWGGGRLIGPDRPVTGICIDSRRVRSGELFFALTGGRAARPRRVAPPRAAGAAAAVADAGRIPGGVRPGWTVIDARDPLAVLGTAATRYRE